MSQLENLFKQQHPNYDELNFEERKRSIVNRIAEERKVFKKENNWMTLDEINNYIDKVRIERNAKEFAGV